MITVQLGAAIDPYRAGQYLAIRAPFARLDVPLFPETEGGWPDARQRASWEETALLLETRHNVQECAIERDAIRGS